MNKRFSKEECETVYEKLLSYASSCLEAGRTDSAYDFLKASAMWAYRFNWIYADKRLDDMIRTIGRTWASPFKIISDSETKYLLIDTHGIDNRGLTQQYIRALIAMNAAFLYVSVYPDINRQKDIRSELASYSLATTCFIDKKMTNRERLNVIIDCVKSYQPKVAIAHVFPWDPIPFMLFDLANNMRVYNINFTDHAFWIGSSIIDYNIEFRSFGMTISIEKRGLNKEQLICLPFYPITQLNETFQGFPELPQDAIKIFSGGSFYKMMGDDDRYFKLCDKLLNLSSHVVLLIAGSGDISLLRRKISTMRNADRVFLIGDRRDIDEVFKHCDIYLNTYPIGGGLMSQYAAKNGKPILILCRENDNSRIESCINHFSNNVKAFIAEDDLLLYAQKCITNKEFRDKEGAKNKNGLMSAERFNDFFKEIFSGKYNDHFHWDRVKINYDDVVRLYLDIENNYTKSALTKLFYVLRGKSLIIFPRYIVYFLWICIHEVIKRAPSIGNSLAVLRDK